MALLIRKSSTKPAQFVIRDKIASKTVVFRSSRSLLIRALDKSFFRQDGSTECNDSCLKDKLEDKSLILKWRFDENRQQNQRNSY